MSRSTLVLAAVAAIVLVWSGPLRAADLAVGRAPIVTDPAACGPCGCLTVTYVYHRELRSTYGIGFDPRNYDETRPHYFFGAVRPYPRYAVVGGTGGEWGHCYH